MLSIIYTSLKLAIVVLALIYLIFITVLMIKDLYNDVACIKARIVFTSILFALFIFKMIPALILGISIGNDILCSVLWAICTILNVSCLEVCKRDTLNSTSTDMESIYNKDVIDVDCTEVQDIDDEKWSITNNYQ